MDPAETGLQIGRDSELVNDRSTTNCFVDEILRGRISCLYWLARTPNEYGATPAAVVDRYVADMLAAVTPGARVWWVNVRHTGWSSVSMAFNQQLGALADASPELTVVDYWTPIGQHLNWFLDRVHVNLFGGALRTQLIIDALPH